MNRCRLELFAIIATVLLAASRGVPPATAGPDRFDAALRSAETAQSQGLYRSAVELLAAALAEAEREGGAPEIEAAILGSLGSAYQASGQPDQAAQALERSLDLARQHGLTQVEAATLTNQGNLLAAEGRLAEALAAYDASAALARTQHRDDLLARALLNGGRIALRQGDPRGAETRLRAAQRSVEGRTSEAAALDSLALSRLLLDLPATAGRQAWAQVSLERASALAAALGDDRLASYAAGYLAQLLETRGQVDDALERSRRAAWLAARGNAADPLYVWQRQIGRLLAAKGRTGEALDSYRDAVRTLQSIRLDLPTFDPRTGRSLFRDVVGPVFLEYTDLLLRQAGQGDGAAAQERLREARLAIETIKAVELQDYFQDDCVAQLQARIRSIERLNARTAALYPILLPDRTELLLTLPDGTIRRATAAIGEPALAEEVHAFRVALETRSTRRFLGLARSLYDLLLRPFEAELARNDVDTLVVVPDGALRTVPLAALHDGRDFVAARFAVATAPGLNLLDPRPIRQVRPRFLLAGLSKGVQGFPPLPSVSTELEAIAQGEPSTVLLDEAFVLPQVQRSLEGRNYTVVHIASHGQFASDPKDSFLLTFDGRLDVDRLERLIKPSLFRDEPVELLTLSACRTAAGDDRAALGLAGLAVKAGARSALASLWFIDDEAAATFVTAFYEALENGAATKAKALQTAQLRMLQDRRYRHPAYWAPFLIIGNWL
jgi:CHAT domain-containing protein